MPEPGYSAPEEFWKRILASNSILTAATIAIRLMGMGEKILISRIFGVSADSDAFILIHSLFIAGWIIVDDLLGPALVPLLSQAGGRTGTRKLAVILSFTVALPVSSLLILPPYLFPAQALDVLCPGFSPHARASAIEVWKLFALGGMPYFLTPIIQAYCHARKEFFIPAVSQFLGRGAMMACIAVAGPSQGIEASGWGMILYGMLYCLLQVVLLKLRRDRGGALPKADAPSAGLVARLAIPQLAGMVVSQASNWVEVRLLSGLPEGSLSLVSYAHKAVDVPVVIGSYCLGAVLLPYFAAFHASRDMVALRKYIASSLKICGAAYLICCLVYLASADMICDAFLSRGMGGSAPNETFTLLVMIFSAGLPAFSAEIILMQAYFAMRYHWRASLIGMAFCGLNLGFTIWLFPVFGIWLIPTLLVLQKSLKSLLLGVLLFVDLAPEQAGVPARTAISSAGT